MYCRVFTRSMSQKVSVIMLNNAEIAEKRLSELKTKLIEIRKFKIEEIIKELTHENAALSKKVEEAKNELIRLETLHGKKQYMVPGKKLTNNTVTQEVETKPNHETIPIKTVETVASDPDQPAPKKEKKDKEGSKKKEKQPIVTNDVVDVRKLDFRIGKITGINKHPDADSLYVEQIDCGEEKPRTVVSGLVNHVPINEMQDRIVMVLCNLKPVKMRGVTSEAMVMCASSPEKVEVLIPPNGSVPGDLVHCSEYPREPEAQLNPKKKIFETCAVDLKTNDEKVACYKGSPLIVPGKGPVVAASLKGVSVK